ncbi:hypothetical protein C5B42_05360, partial [Candidatus Cerribacteria bacterium 'Amazon FNV 2010 28 9']
EQAAALTRYLSNTDTVLHYYISEVLRLYPATFSLPYSVAAQEGIDVAFGYPYGSEVSGHLPGGLGISVVLPAMHRDPNFWNSPNEFNINRWNEEDPMYFRDEERHVDQRDAYFPFNNGSPRDCIGRALAMMEIKLFLINWISNFETTRFAGGVSTQTGTLTPEHKSTASFRKRAA